MTTAQKESMYQRITKHGEDLKALFRLDREIDPVKLCKALRRLEVKAHKLAEDYCNGADGLTSENIDIYTNTILISLDHILGQYKEGGVPVFVNLDARGYALKVRDEYVREHGVSIYRDWGGYGIIAPDLTEV